MGDVEWMTLLTVVCTCITVVLTAWNVLDKIAERRPLAIHARGNIYVSNPRKKAVLIRKMVLSATFPDRTAREDVFVCDQVVVAGETAILACVDYDETVERCDLKRIYLLRWDGFDLHVRTHKKSSIPKKADPDVDQKTDNADDAAHGEDDLR